MKTIFYRPSLTTDDLNKTIDVYRRLSNAKEDFPDHLILATEEGELPHINIVDDMDDRTETFFVDIPQLKSDGTGSDEWRNVESFKTKEAAIKFAKDNFGADENGMVSLISQS